MFLLERLIILPILIQLVVGEYCTEQKDDGSRPFPAISDTQSYQMNVEVNIEDYNMTLEVESYFDGNKQLEMVKYLLPINMGGASIQAIMNYKEQQVFAITDGWNCTTFNITGDEMQNMFGMPAEDVGFLSRGFKMLHGFSKAYIPQNPPVTVRGIIADHWSSCVKLPKLNTTMTIDYYFSARDWSHPVTEGPVLLRMVAKGITTTNPPIPFENSYDYTSFRPLILDPKVFQIPKNVYCKGEISTKDIPRLPDQFSYRIEITLLSLNISFKVVQYKDVWYDFNKQLIKLDYRTYEKGVTENNNPVSMIHDFNTGVSYTIDKIKETCTVGSISSTYTDTTFEPSQLKDENAHVIQMKNPEELFYLTSKYLYVGQDTVRGINCDVFITELPYKPGGDGLSRFEYYFSSSNWFLVNNLGEKPSQEVPVMLKITNKNGYAAEYNFFDFSTNDLSSDVFSVSGCYAESEKKHISVEFPGPYFGKVENNIPAFKGFVQMALADAAMVSPLRIQDLDLDYFVNINAIYVTFTLLDQAPRKAQFTNGISKRNPNKPDYVQPQVYTTDDCMEYCLEASNIVCNSFDFCDNKCFMFQTHGGTKDLTDSTTCTHFSRVVDGNGIHEEELFGAWQELRTDVYEGTLKVLLMETDGSAYTTYVAKSIRDNIVRDESGMQPENIMKKFERTKRNMKLLPKISQTFSVKTSVDECAALCVQEKTFQCSSFSYCHFVADVTDQCFISSAHPDVDKNTVFEESGCDVYSRDYLDAFNKYEGSTGLTVGKTYPSLQKSAKDCATDCSLSGKVDCKSFYYCLSADPKGPTCFTSESRKPGISDPSYAMDDYCQFYSKKYIDLFIPLGNYSVTSLTDGILFGDVSIESCIERCMEDIGETECTDFKYCPNELPPICFLPVPGYKYEGSKSVTGECRHYAKKPSSVSTTATTSLSTAEGQTGDNNQGGKFTGAHMAALGLGMAILGALLGAIMYWSINRARITISGKSKEDTAGLTSNIEMAQATERA